MRESSGEAMFAAHRTGWRSGWTKNADMSEAQKVEGSEGNKRLLSQVDDLMKEMDHRSKKPKHDAPTDDKMMHRRMTRLLPVPVLWRQLW